jgi:hypothetical protein
MARFESLRVAALALADPSPDAGRAAYESVLTPNGERWIWIEEMWLNKLGAMRGPGEDYSAVILRLAEVAAVQRLP